MAGLTITTAGDYDGAGATIDFIEINGVTSGIVTVNDYVIVATTDPYDAPATEAIYIHDCDASVICQLSNLDISHGWSALDVPAIDPAPTTITTFFEQCIINNSASLGTVNYCSFHLCRFIGLNGSLDISQNSMIKDCYFQMADNGYKAITVSAGSSPISIINVLIDCGTDGYGAIEITNASTVNIQNLTVLTNDSSNVIEIDIDQCTEINVDNCILINDNAEGCLFFLDYSLPAAADYLLPPGKMNSATETIDAYTYEASSSGGLEDYPAWLAFNTYIPIGAGWGCDGQVGSYIALDCGRPVYVTGVYTINCQRSYGDCLWSIIGSTDGITWDKIYQNDSGMPDGGLFDWGYITSGTNFSWLEGYWALCKIDEVTRLNTNSYRYLGIRIESRGNVAYYPINLAELIFTTSEIGAVPYLSDVSIINNDLRGTEYFYSFPPIVTYKDNITSDPLFVSSSTYSSYIYKDIFPNGFFLSQIAAGEASDSPCVDTGHGNGALGTTRTDFEFDNGVIDIGFHYPISEMNIFVHPVVFGELHDFNGNKVSAFT